MYASKLSLCYVLVSLIFLAGACTQTDHYRTKVIIGEGLDSVTDLICDVAAENQSDKNNDLSSEDSEEIKEDKPCAKTIYFKNGKEIVENNKHQDAHKLKVKQADAAIQHRYYSKGPKEKEGDYYLAFVEFDDQGWFEDRKQMEALLRLLEEDSNEEEKDEEEDSNPKNEFLIFVFAHGWRHNSHVCDENVVCFQRILERFDLLEKITTDEVNKNRKQSDWVKKRKVVGVYLGWRGLSAKGPLIEFLSFWDRKNTAQKVGLGGTTELLARLNDFRDYKNPKREGDKTQLIIMGHSFGGKVIYTALSHSLIERAAKSKIRVDQEKKVKKGSYNSKEDRIINAEKNLEGQKPPFYPIANSFGDLVILINPAFEGSRYEPLHNLATNRCFPQGQRPALMVVTSEADWATDVTFPIGRYLSNAFESTKSPEQRKTVLHTVGHLDRYKTHEIKFDDKVDTDHKKVDCGCRYLEPTYKFYEKFKKEGKDFVEEITGDLIEDLDRINKKKLDIIKIIKPIEKKENEKLSSVLGNFTDDIKKWLKNSNQDGGDFINKITSDLISDLQEIRKKVIESMEENEIEVSQENYTIKKYEKKYGKIRVVLGNFKKDTILYGNVIMTRNQDRNYSRNFPYLVIKTDGNLIAGHNEIYGEEFTGFIRRFYLRHIKYKMEFPRDCYEMPKLSCKPTAFEPCMQSCGMDENGKSCSDRKPD